MLAHRRRKQGPDSGRQWKARRRVAMGWGWGGGELGAQLLRDDAWTGIHAAETPRGCARVGDSPASPPP